MPRRMIHDELFSNIDLGECSIETRLLYIGMIVHSDDAGRMRADVRYLRAKIFPFDNLPDDTCLTWRNQLATKGVITLYDVGGKTYLQHPKWDRWQTLRKDRMRPSDCPSPSVDAATKWQPRDNQAADRRLTNDGVTEVNRTEVNRTEDTNTLAQAPKRATFVKPDVAGITDYARSIGAGIDAQQFFDHYESNGWKVGRNPMKDWKATVRTWKKRNGEFNHVPAKNNPVRNISNDPDRAKAYAE